MGKKKKGLLKKKPGKKRTPKRNKFPENRGAESDNAKKTRQNIYGGRLRGGAGK